MLYYLFLIYLAVNFIKVKIYIRAKVKIFKIAKQAIKILFFIKTILINIFLLMKKILQLKL